ncbi:hypothetical protein LGN10_20390 [Burkholderia sp. AU32262]|nr:hypothetical protein [Burkholderia sp. AU32262]
MARRPMKPCKHRGCGALVADGSPGKRQLNTQEPDFGLVTNIEPPEWLDPQAVEMWERVAPLLCKQKTRAIQRFDSSIDA